MSYNIEIEIRDHFLFATASGERTDINVEAIAKKIVDECARNKIANVYLDLCQLTGRLSILESLLVITKVFPEMGIFRKLERVAVLESSERNERSRFFEQAAQARGYNIRMFDNRKEATDWLSECGQPA